MPTPKARKGVDFGTKIAISQSYLRSTYILLISKHIKENMRSNV
jgi:hypothetical protein